MLIWKKTIERRWLPGFFSTVLVLGSLFAESEAQWAQFRGPDRSGVSAETGLAWNWPSQGPPRLWRGNLGEGFSGISVSGNRVITLYGRDQSTFVVCFDAETGKRIWQRRLGPKLNDSQGNGPRSTPTIADGLVFTLTGLGALAALELESGEVRWQKDLSEDFGAFPPQWGYATSPLIVGGVLYLEVGGRPEQAFVAMEAKTGQLIWASLSDSPAYSSPILAHLSGDLQLIFLSAQGLVSLVPETGQLNWRYRWKTAFDVNVATPLVVSPDRIFISSSYDRGGVLLKISKAQTGYRTEEMWRNRVMKNHFHSAVLSGGYLFGFDNGTLKCVNVENGRHEWRHRGLGRGSLIAVDENLIVLSEQGQVLVVDATHFGFRPKSKFQAFQGRSWTPPSLADGRLYLRDEKEIQCLNLKP